MRIYIVAIMLLAFARITYADVTVDTGHMVDLPDGAKYVKLTESYTPFTPDKSRQPITDSSVSYNLVICGRGMVWGVSNKFYYKGSVVDINFSPRKMALSDIAPYSTAETLYKAVCGNDYDLRGGSQG